ncbi:MAG: zincin-like metallopeptidase domain-containing protein [Alkaliphilus sp.]|nr:zincin-like metallopeptidase domain-containing protein [Alkaliphilus sp.]
MKKTVYEIVTEKIIEKLEKGTIPWRTPWNSKPAVNWNTQRAYNGINAILLDPGEYATFNQIREAGGKVKKGEKSQLVVFWKWIEKENDDGKTDKIPFLRYYNVFEISTQCEGLTSRRKDTEEYNHDPIEAAEAITAGYANSPEIKFAPGRAYYRPSDDFISVPELKDYKKPEEYYSTLFHEMIHSTGNKTRLDRKGITEIAAFGSETYSKEELVAEIGAAMLCGKAQIENATIENSAAYIKSWMRKLKEDSRLIVTAASQAQKAADYIQGIS